MNLSKVRDFLFDSRRDLQDRQFVLLSVLMQFFWGVTLLVSIALGEKLSEFVWLLIALVVYAVVTVLSVRLNRIRTGAVVASAFVSLVYPTSIYVFGGGAKGNAPLLFAFGIFFITLCLDGRTRIVFYILDAVAVVTCWSLSYFAPSVIEREGYVVLGHYSFNSLLLVSVCVSISIIYQNRMYRRESVRSEEQRHEIEALNRAQNQFFSNMSHEIRTPINTIIGFNEMILREDISDEVADDAANIQSSSKMLLHLINDILDMSKLASGQMHLTPVTYNPGDMLSDIVGMLWLRAREKKLEFHVNVSPDIPAELFGDEVRIKQILINVLNNAIKYTKEGSVSLTVQCGEYSDGMLNIIYSVSDTGIGIKKESIPFLFTAFRRVDEEKNRHIEGTGLGLSIVKQLTDLMGGKVTVNSVYTEGTTFIIEIPQRVMGDQKIGEVNIEEKRKAHERQGHVTRFEAPEAKVLVVDDNVSNLLVVSKLLRDTKVQLTTVGSGAEALQKTLDEYYHVIFMDHLMPEMDGIECLKAIRSQTGGHCRESRIVVLTANAGADCAAQYEKAGFDGYLVKPINGDQLERELYGLLPPDITHVLVRDDDIIKDTISWMNRGQRKAGVAITTDSMADLPEELIDKYHIALLPHLVYTEEGTFKDGIEIETQGLLGYMDDPSKVVRCGSVDTQSIESFFAEQLRGATDIIHISISGGLINSGYYAAQEASKAFDNVRVFDSGHLSAGQGLVVLEACRIATEGKTPDEIMEQLAGSRDRVCTSFMIDNLDFLARSGQISHGAAGIAKSMMARAVLVLKRGKLTVGRFYFGAKERAWKKYIDSALRHPEEIDKRILLVTCVGITRNEMDWIREKINEKMKFDAIYFKKASSVIAVHCGRETFGLMYMKKKTERI